MAEQDTTARARATFPFDNSYARLPVPFQLAQMPTPVRAPRLIKLNRELAQELGLDLSGLDDQALADLFSGNALPEGAQPLAMAYSGHQFGGFNPNLGDGRAILLGEVVDVKGQRRDIQLKGAGPTPFSRRGDGRAALGPVLREYIVSEAMHALNIPATRALAAVSTGEPVYRQPIQPGGVFTRVAASHIRVGTFQFFASRGDEAGLKHLADYVIERHYPHVMQEAHPYLALLDSIMDAQAQLIAKWMAIGFIHGVMNTDNMTVSGQTIDFGPCAFIDTFDPMAVFSSIDERGRYAWGNQPGMAQWNLARLTECLLPLISDKAEEALKQGNDRVVGFANSYQRYWLVEMRAKLGLEREEAEDAGLISGLMEALHQGRADFTRTFRALANLSESGSQGLAARDEFTDPAPFDLWLPQWQARLTRETHNPHERAMAMQKVNPAFIPRNHRIEEVIEAAVERDDFQPFETLNRVLSQPFEDQPEFEVYTHAPLEHERVLATFCGT
jgi:serine/tyrosine/threonine adenylyltransferase